MTFPDQKYTSMSDYVTAYGEQMADAWASLDGAAVGRAADLLAGVIGAGNLVYACGNGGSAAISNHLLCDFAKGIQTDTVLKPRVVSLSSNIEIITAIANDIAFEDVFVYQLKTMAKAGDLLITVSSSGDSENVVRALEWATGNRLKTVALTGFGGGRTSNLADVNIHVGGDNYGVIEDMHQSVMHMLAQYLRLQAMDEGLIAERKF